MDQISQKELDKVVRFIKNSDYQADDIQKIADKISKADIIPAMYMMVYVKKVYELMKKCEKKDTKRLEFDHEKWKEIMKMNYQLEIETFTDTPDTFEGAFWMAYHAVDRLNKFCDYDDSKASPTKMGRCENPDDHFENVDEPIVTLTTEGKKEYDEYALKNGVYQAMKKFPDYFNPVTELTAVNGFDEDSAKMLHSEVYYICKHCINANEEQDGGNPVCDSEVGE